MKKFNKKSLVLLITAALLLTFTVSGTVAYLVAGTEAVTNTFTPSEITSKVDEPGWNDGNTVKSNVSIEVIGNLEVYVRAAIVVTWQDNDGNVAPIKPVLGTDYTLSIGSNWTQGNDGFYYLKGSIQATKDENGNGSNTPTLITTCEVKTELAGYRLVVDVLGQTIQAEPSNVVSNAWGSAAAVLVQ